MIPKYANTFGIRKVEYSAEKGLLLNGKPIELNGGCLHHDNGPLGAASYDRAEERKVELMKAAGFNAVGYVSEGTAHEFLTWRRSLREMAPLLFRK